MKCAHEICGILFPQYSPFEPHDPEGCKLPNGHDGPHKFKCEDGEIWNWETDWGCDCEHCNEAEGDYCVLYWEEKI